MGLWLLALEDASSSKKATDRSSPCDHVATVTLSNTGSLVQVGVVACDQQCA